MFDVGSDPLWPWLRFRPPPDDLPGFRIGPLDVGGESGLSDWQPSLTGAARPDLPDTTATPPAVEALRELDDGNYNICTVGTGNAYDGYFEAVRKGVPTGQRR
jgi:hypothetical protein